MHLDSFIVPHSYMKSKEQRTEIRKYYVEKAKKKQEKKAAKKAAAKTS